MSLVTVIITVFHRTDFLEAAISSVLAQTFQDWECLISDDANSLKSQEVWSRFSNDKRIRYRANATTLGTPLNVAAALRDARGKYVAILNDDDLFYPRMLELLVAPLEANPQVVAAFGNHEVMDASGKLLTKETKDLMRLRRRNQLQQGIVPEPIDFAIRRGLMVGMGCVFRRSVCDPAWLVTDVGGAYDYWLPVKLAMMGKFYFVPEAIMAWRSHENSVSAMPSPEKFRAEVAIYGWLSEQSLAPGLRRYIRAQLAYFLYLQGKEFLLNGSDRIGARLALWRAFKLDPSLRFLGTWVLSFMPAFLRCVAVKAWQWTRPLRSKLIYG